MRTRGGAPRSRAPASPTARPRPPRSLSAPAAGAKARIVVSFAQVVSQLERVYDLRYPESFRAQLRVLGEWEEPVARVLAEHDGVIEHWRMRLDAAVPRLAAEARSGTSRATRAHGRAAARGPAAREPAGARSGFSVMERMAGATSTSNTGPASDASHASRAA